MKVHMRVGNYPRVVKVIWSVGVRKETMSDEDVSSFRFNLGEVLAVCDVGVETFERWIESFGMVVEDVADSWFNGVSMCGVTVPKKAGKAGMITVNRKGQKNKAVVWHHSTHL